MPIFEYKCRKCGTEFEKIVPRHDSEVECVHCHSAKVEKLLSVFAVSGGASSADFASPAGCGTCGAPRPGMCQMSNT